jgi:hypothetical protein
MTSTPSPSDVNIADGTHNGLAGLFFGAGGV